VSLQQLRPASEASSPAAATAPAATALPAATPAATPAAEPSAAAPAAPPAGSPAAEPAAAAQAAEPTPGATEVAAQAAADHGAALADAGAPAGAEPSLSDTAKSLGVAGKALAAAKFESAEFNSVTFDGATMTGAFTFENPTGSPLTFEKLDYALVVGPNKLIGGSTGSKVAVEGGARQRIAVPITLQFLAVPGLVASLIKGKAKFAVEALATMRSADGTAFVVPMRWNGDLALPKPPSVKVSKLELTDVGLTEIVLTLQVDIANPNAFPIPLDAAVGTLSISRAQVAKLALAAPKLLAAGGTTSVDLPITIAVEDVAGEVIKQVRSGKATFELAAELKVAGKSIPFSYRSAARRR
jgi:LEA14-like dessication related protein